MATAERCHRPGGPIFALTSGECLIELFCIRRKLLQPKGVMMKKLIALTALAGLVAAGCASHENSGGTYDNQYSTTSSSGTMSTTPANNSATSSTVPTNNSGTSGTLNNNSPSSDTSNGTTTPPNRSNSSGSAKDQPTPNSSSNSAPDSSSSNPSNPNSNSSNP